MKVGDYVRTKDYGISKIYMVYKQFVLITTNYKQIMNEDIIKSSPNIIDLIEIGDYVNGCKVISNDSIEIYLDTKDLFEQNIYKQEDIKSILTKEQFESMEYKVKEQE